MMTLIKHIVVLFVGLLTLSHAAFAQNMQDTCWIHGFVYDAETGEPIIASDVYVQESQIGVSTDIYGYYELRIPRLELNDGEAITINVKVSGYETFITSIGFRDGEVRKSVHLDPLANWLSDPSPYLEKELKMSKMAKLQVPLIPPVFYGDDGGTYFTVLPGVVRKSNPRVNIASWSGPGSCLRIDVTYDDF